MKGNKQELTCLWLRTGIWELLQCQFQRKDSVDSHEFLWKGGSPTVTRTSLPDVFIVSHVDIEGDFFFFSGEGSIMAQIQINVHLFKVLFDAFV